MTGTEDRAQAAGRTQRTARTHRTSARHAPARHLGPRRRKRPHTEASRCAPASDTSPHYLLHLLHLLTILPNPAPPSHLTSRRLPRSALYPSDIGSRVKRSYLGSSEFEAHEYKAGRQCPRSSVVERSPIARSAMLNWLNFCGFQLFFWSQDFPSWDCPPADVSSRAQSSTPLYHTRT